MHFYIIVMGS